MVSGNRDSVMSVTKSFGKHPSIVKIKIKALDSASNFRKTSCDLSIINFCQEEDILSKIIKLNKGLIVKFIAENFICCTENCKFSSELKHADVVPIHKNKDKNDKSNYRPVSIISDYSKMYENLIYNQLYQYFENILFLSQCQISKRIEHSALSLSPNRKI